MTIQVAIGEDDGEICENLPALIDDFSEFPFMAARATAEAALEEISRRQPEVVLTDTRLPGVDQGTKGFRYKEIAEALDIGVKTVRTHSKYLRKSFTFTHVPTRYQK